MHFHACLVSLLSSDVLVDDASQFVAIKRSLHGLTDWQGLGLQLGMNLPYLSTISKIYGNNMEICKTTMLHSWLKTGKATKGKLVDALRRMGEDSTADKLEESKGKLNF